MISNKFELQFTFKLNRLRWKVTSLFLLLGMISYSTLTLRLIDIEPVPSLMGKKQVYSKAITLPKVDPREK